MKLPIAGLVDSPVPVDFDNPRKPSASRHASVAFEEEGTCVVEFEFPKVGRIRLRFLAMAMSGAKVLALRAARMDQLLELQPKVKFRLRSMDEPETWYEVTNQGSAINMGAQIGDLLMLDVRSVSRPVAVEKPADTQAREDPTPFSEELIFKALSADLQQSAFKNDSGNLEPPVVEPEKAPESVPEPAQDSPVEEPQDPEAVTLVPIDGEDG